VRVAVDGTGDLVIGRACARGSSWLEVGAPVAAI